MGGQKRHMDKETLDKRADRVKDLSELIPQPKENTVKRRIHPKGKELMGQIVDRVRKKRS